MAIQTEIWVKDIEETLHQGSEFIKMGTDHSAFVENKTAHVPQSGSVSAIQKNISSLPATIVQRTDTVLDYSLNQYTIDPVLVTSIEELQSSYAKRQSVMSQHIATLNERIGTETAYEWAPTTSATLVLRTTGAATSLLPNATATGTRKLITKADVAKMAQKMDQDNVPSNDRVLVLPVQMYYELFDLDALVRNDFGRALDMINGEANMLYGFKIFKRPTTVSYNEAAAGVKKAVGAADAATDCVGAFAFQKSCVASALGTIKVYAEEGKAAYYGDIFSAEVMHGAKYLRTDTKGIVALAQGYVAP